MKASDIRELTDGEIRARIRDEEEHYQKMRLNHAVSEIENPSKIRSSRRTIAQLKTILREREMIKDKEQAG